MRKLKQLSVKRSDFLLVAATVVAALRLMLINASFIGFDVKQWAWFAPAEVWSGIAFAVLEGVALAYVSKRWRRLEPQKLTEWVYWAILLGGQIVLLASIIGVTAFAATATRRGMSIDALLGAEWAAVWSMVVAGLNPLIVILIGIVEDDDATSSSSLPMSHATRAAIASDILTRWAQQHGGEQLPRPDWLRGEFARQTGQPLPLAEAEAALVAWRGQARGEASEEPGGEADPVEALLEAVEQESRIGYNHRRLIELLKDERGLTWTEVAERVGKGESTVQRWYAYRNGGSAS